ncbi:MAG TPA: hypothetical protein DEF12_09075 [Rhodobacteraceae bacterium]|jgi:uncharacterized membrane protein YdjX (TVP38/TMEM64 family)|nr:hypothetical protein [Paracoccaceae bacterium]HBV55171.1 hypothetical protein [Paracoccaceae bacterium]
MPDHLQAPKPSPLRGRALIVTLFAGAALGAFFLRDFLDFETLARHRSTLIDFRDSHYTLSALLFLCAYVAIVAFSLPGGTLATLTGGFLFGLFPGAVFNIVAATIGAAIIFSAVRAGFGEKLAARLSASEGAVGRLKQGIDANQWEMLLLMRLVPVVPFFMANIVPALVGVTLGPFVITTFLGIIPAGLVFTSIGSGLGEVFARGDSPDLSLFFSPKIMGPILGIAALAALPMVLRAYKARKGI